MVRRNQFSQLTGALIGGALAFCIWKFSPYLEPTYLTLQSKNFFQLPRKKYGVLSDVYRTVDSIKLPVEDRKEALDELPELMKIYKEIDLENLSESKRAWLQGLKETDKNLENLAITFENGYSYKGYKGVQVKELNDRDAIFLWILRYKKGYPVAIPQTSSYSGQQSPAAMHKVSH